MWLGTSRSLAVFRDDVLNPIRHSVRDWLAVLPGEVMRHTGPIDLHGRSPVISHGITARFIRVAPSSDELVSGATGDPIIVFTKKEEESRTRLGKRCRSWCSPNFIVLVVFYDSLHLFLCQVTVKEWI